MQIIILKIKWKIIKINTEIQLHIIQLTLNKVDTFTCSHYIHELHEYTHEYVAHTKVY